MESLVQVALQRRPEMGARAALVAEAETRLGQEIARPLLPTFWLGFSGGGFGGGSNLVGPSVGNFAGRTDFDVRLYWTLQNLGMGNLAIQKQRRAAIGQAIGEQSRMINSIRREVASAKATRDRRTTADGCHRTSTRHVPGGFPRRPRSAPKHRGPADRIDE